MRLRLPCEERENANDNSAMLLTFYKKRKINAYRRLYWLPRL